MARTAAATLVTFGAVGLVGVWGYTTWKQSHPAIDLGKNGAPGFLWNPSLFGPGNVQTIKEAYVIGTANNADDAARLAHDWAVRNLPGSVPTGAATPPTAAPVATGSGIASALVDLGPYGAGGLAWHSGTHKVVTINEGTVIGEATSASAAAEVGKAWFGQTAPAN